MTKYTGLILSLLLLLFITSCSSHQDLTISSTGEGSVIIDVNLDDILISYTQDLLGGFSGSESSEIRLFDTAKVIDSISNIDSVSLIDINSESADKLHLELAFLDPGKIFAESKVYGIPDLISFSSKTAGKNVNIISIYLSKDNFKTVLGLIGMEDSEILDTFGPQDNPYTDIEYLDLMEFLFEEYASSLDIRSIVKSSEIVISLNVDGNITKCYGCTGSGSTALIKIPLLDIVTLVKPIEISVEWK